MKTASKKTRAGFFMVLLAALCVAAQQPAETSKQPDSPFTSPQHPQVKTKAPVVIPSKPFDRTGETIRQGQSKSISPQLAPLAATSTDTTPPIAPTQVTASAQGITTINAQWDSGSDPESGISYYIFGIGTNSSGDYNTLA
ncbi:MAG TPA: hypothetical protein VES66_06690, partial [Terriglobales bacterium]|nr:hypothetical protein [Terriglobales bacterium]